jgi:hypothetical protein
MACTFSEDDHFTYVNRCIDEYIHEQENLTEGGGGSRVDRDGSRKVVAQRSSRFISSARLMPILRRMSEAGFRKLIIDRYSLLTDDMLLDYHGDIFVIGVIQNYARRFSYDDTISTTLKKIGLRHTKVIHVQEILEPLLGECYTYAQIIDIAIEYLFGRCFQTIGKKNDTHYLKPDIVNTWIDVNSKQIYNASLRCDSQNAQIALLDAIQSAASITDNDKNNDLYNIYYHTTNWEGALSIMDGGINHSAGRKCLDFGWQGGFYIGDSAENAIQWGVRRSAATQHETAIILFRLSSADMDAKKLRYRELKGDDWKKITKKSRMCLREAYNEMSELRRIDYIYGPMVRNVEEVARGMGEPRTHTPPKYQLVSKTDDGDEYLHDNIIGCVFFQKFVG